MIAAGATNAHIIPSSKESQQLKMKTKSFFFLRQNLATLSHQAMGEIKGENKLPNFGWQPFSEKDKDRNEAPSTIWLISGSSCNQTDVNVLIID